MELLKTKLDVIITKIMKQMTIYIYVTISIIITSTLFLIRKEINDLKQRILVIDNKMREESKNVQTIKQINNDDVENESTIDDNNESVTDDTETKDD